MSAAKQLPKDFLSKAISMVLVVVTLLILLPQLYHFGLALKTDVKSAVNGHVVITSADMSSSRMYALGGEWHFFWQQFLTHQEILNSSDEATTISGVGGWQDSKNGHSFDPDGFATYHLHVVLQGVNENLALRIPYIETAYRLYVDDELLASAGIVSDSENQAMAGYNSTLVLLPQGLNEFSIRLHVSNYHSIWGGIWEPIVIGEADSLYKLNRNKVAFSLFILGTLLITAIHALIQYYLMPDNKPSLIFACLCFILILREMTDENLYFGLSSLGLTFSTLKKLSYLTYYVGIPVALYFVNLCFKSEFSRKTTRIFYSIGFLFSVYVLLSPVKYLGHSLMVFQYIAPVMMLYGLSRIIVAVRKKKVGANVMMVGIVILIIFVLNDILYVGGVIMTGRFVSLGVIGFIISQSYVGSKRVNSLIARNKKLSKKLENRNTKLELMSELLESKVEKRTRQLEDANIELKQLANEDKLTKSLNRHGLQHHLIAAFERYRRTKKVFSIVLLDFDSFKEINDSYGHDIGDIVLQSGSQVIKKCIREQDKLARWGGEEFLVLLPDTNLEGATAIADKLRLAIQNHVFPNSPPDLHVTVTGGAGVVQDEDTFEMIFKRVDTALYKGKHAGKNCIYS